MNELMNGTKNIPIYQKKSESLQSEPTNYIVYSTNVYGASMSDYIPKSDFFCLHNISNNSRKVIYCIKHLSEILR